MGKGGNWSAWANGVICERLGRDLWRRPTGRFGDETPDFSQEGFLNHEVVIDSFGYPWT
jgi:hypothetical protein